MRSTFYGLEISRSGLYMSQDELNVTAHNIANSDTVGYTRQRLSTAAIPAPALNTQFAVDTSSQSGAGVNSINVTQIRDSFLDAQFREEAPETAYWNEKTTQYEIIENLFNSALETSTTSASIYSALSSFRTAMNSLADNPSSKDLRTNLQQSGIQLAESFNYVYDQLKEHHDNINSAIKIEVGEVNDICDTVANLNKMIFAYELNGSVANDLRDTRNALVDELSGKINIVATEDTDGYVNITIGNRSLLDRTEVHRLTVDPQGCDNQLDVMNNIDPPSKQYTVVWEDDNGGPGLGDENLVIFNSGSIKALVDVRDGGNEESMGIPYVVDQLNQLARTIAKDVNGLHRTGYTMPYDAATAASNGILYAHTLDANGEAVVDPAGNYVMEALAVNADGYYESRQGLDFFDAGNAGDYSEINASNFQLSQGILNNVYLIAASSTKVLTPTSTTTTDGNEYKGDALNLKDIIALYDQKDAMGNSISFESRLTSLVVSIGTEMKHIDNMYTAQQTRQESIKTQRAAVCSVSLDEEMTNVVRFTHAYNANARVLTAMDEELDTLINKLGTVGR